MPKPSKPASGDLTRLAELLKLPIESVEYLDALPAADQLVLAERLEAAIAERHNLVSAALNDAKMLIPGPLRRRVWRKFGDGDENE